jgi:zinc and cadmium transporter
VPLLATALGLSLLGSCGGLLVASSLLLFNEQLRTRLVPWLVSYAVGALLGVALLALLPEALDELKPPAVFGTLLAGILVFFVLENLVRGTHANECQVHGATVPLVLIGDAFPPSSRRDHLYGGPDIGAARHQHGHRGRRP